MVNVRSPYVSEAGALQWRLERDPALRTTPLEIAVVGGPVDDVLLRSRLQRLVDEVPELRATLRRAPLSSAPPRFVADPHFDLDDHLLRVRADGVDAGGLAQIARAALRAELDRGLPLWACTVVERAPADRTAVMLQVHRAVAERMPGDRLLLDRLLDFPHHRAGTGPRLDDVRSLLQLRMQAGAHERRRLRGAGRRMARAVLHAAADPVGAGFNVVETATSLSAVVAAMATPLNSYFGDRCGRVELALLRLPAADVDDAAARHRVDARDVLVGATLLGMHAHGDVEHSPTHEARVRLLEQGAEGRRTPAVFVAPMEPAETGALLGAVRASAHEARVEHAQRFVEPLAGLANRAPGSVVGPLVRRLLTAADASFVFRDDVADRHRLGGALVEELVVVDPPGGAAVQVSSLRHGGDHSLAVAVDRVAVPDASAMLSCIADALARVVGRAPVVVART